MPKLDLPVGAGLDSRYITANGIQYHVLEHGDPTAPHKIMMVHGNVSAATWWEEVMLALPADQYHCVALDLRGYGMSDAAPVDATRGLGSFVDDVRAVAEVLGWDKYHYWGHSMGTGVGMQYLLIYPEQLQSLVLIAAMSPYGFGGTKDVAGTPYFADYAASGGMMFNRDLMRMMAENYRGTDHPAAPLNTLRNIIMKPPFVHDREDVLLSALIGTHLSDDNLPGDATASTNWPTFAPGTRGTINAMSPKYFNVSAIADLPNKPPILWVRGDEDAIISNESLSDIATYGKMGLVPGYPGVEVCPPQPMVDQIKDVMTRYGNCEEVVMVGCGHSPQMERFDEFMTIVMNFLNKLS